HAARVGGGPGQLRDPLRVEQLDRRAPLLPRRGARPQALERGRVRGRRDPAAPLGVARDLVTRDELEDEIGGAACDRGHPSPRLLAELTLELVRLVLETRDDLAAVPA